MSFSLSGAPMRHRPGTSGEVIARTQRGTCSCGWRGPVRRHSADPAAADRAGELAWRDAQRHAGMEVAA